MDDFINCFFLPTSLVDIFFCVFTFCAKTDGVAIISLNISHLLLLYFLFKYMIPQFCILQLVVLSTLGPGFLSASSLPLYPLLLNGRKPPILTNYKNQDLLLCTIPCTINKKRHLTAFLFLLLN